MRDLSQLAVEKETVPGTAETLAAANVLVRLREGDAPEVPVEQVDTEEVQEYSSTRPAKPGVARFSAAVSWVLRPSATPASVAPSCGLLFEMGLLKQDAVREISIGVVSGGPFQDGEPISGSISGATGRVFRPCSATPLKYVPVTSTFQNGDLITGATSGASATASGSPSSKGFLYQLTDSDFTGGSDSKHHATVEYLRGGYYLKGKGVLGEISMEFRNNLHCICRSSMLGALDAHGDKALYDLPSGYPDDGIVEPRFVSASLVLGAYSPTDLVDMNLSIPLGLELREDAQTATGIRFADYLRRGSPPIVTFEPAMMSAATYDIVQKLKDGETFAMSWRLGTDFYFYADECQVLSVGVGNRRSLATVPIQVRLCGMRNNELQIWAASA
jgi:hypothetical protein